MDDKDDNFKMYNDEETKALKKYLINTLNTIQTLSIKFLKKCESFPKLKEEINNLICSHPIYKNRQKIHQFALMVMNSEKQIKEKIIDIQEQSYMRQKRKEELDSINNFLSTGYKKMLTDGSEQMKIKKLLPAPKKEEKQDDKEDNDKGKDNNNSENILFDFTKKDEKETEKENEEEIIVEDTKDYEMKKFLQKKRKKLKDKNQNSEKQKVIFKNCYICKEKFGLNNIHSFYGNLCKKCGDYNYSFRTMKLDFTGRIAIVTGGRVKIGYYIATKLLSYGAKVLITSRFPKDTLFKYQNDPEYEKWKNNLIIYPIDFRIFESTIKFVQFIKDNFPHVDILINNAAQTIRRTASYYKYLLPIETKNLSKEDDKKIIKNDFINLQKQLKAGESTQAPNPQSTKKEIQNSLISLMDNKSKEYQEILPLSVIASQIRIMEEKSQPHVTVMGGDGQPYDFSKGKNSWNFEFDEIPFQEFTEVQIINTWTPYYLCVKLKPLMMQSPFPDKYIVNVTSVEGIFSHFKRSSHVHTNMAKAALNMFTRTCVSYLKDIGIYMTCVDTGWVSPMNEMNSLLDKDKKNSYENEFMNVPLDELDGAMRVLHPIIEGIKNKNYLFGILLKDYVKSPW
jgi:NAD(P)-dependent dehydrogenase (short-subunit alcohol dehydrogenase family)